MQVENVSLPLYYQGVGARDNKSDEISTKVWIRDRSSHLPSELSGGQKQRVAIARAM